MTTLEKVKRGALSYQSYDEAVRNYEPNERWQVFDGTREHFNIAHECVDRHTAKGVAVRVKSSDGEIQEFGFKDISRSSSQFANFLRTLKLEKGSRIGIFLEPCFEFYTSFFGTLKGGAAAVMGSRLLGEQSVTYRLQNSGASLAIVDDELDQLAKSSGVKNVVKKSKLLEKIAGEGEKFRHSTSVMDVAVIQYTSGTTGMPKPIEYHHRSLVSLAPVARFAYGIADDDNFFCPSPVGWGHGIWGGICAPLMFGVRTATRSGKFEPLQILDAIRELKINNISMSPSAFRKLLLLSEASDFDCDVQKISYTGEQMDADTFSKIRKAFGVDPCCMYGSTEVGVIIANYAGFKDWEVKPGSLGKPMPGLKVAVIGEDGSIAKPDEIGYISVALSGRWVKVGDLGVVDQDGFFWYRGRADDVIKTSGYRIGPEEIETIINTHQAVLESAVIGVPDSLLGQRIVAFVKLHENYAASEQLESEIQKFMRKKIGAHAYPRSVRFVDEIPKSIDGKIRRKELRSKYSP